MRITRRTRSPRALGSQLLYLTRNAVLPGELSTGRTLQGPDDLRDLRDRWVTANEIYAARPTGLTQSLGVVLSMPAGTSLERLTDAARSWAHETLSPHTEWFMVPHADQACPHVHLSVRSVQDNGQRVRAAPGEVQEWREAFARHLGHVGIEALATSQREKIERLRQESPAVRLEPLAGLHL